MNKGSILKIKNHLKEAEKIAEEELGISNIFYNEGFIELFMADDLNHKWNSETQGGDAYEMDESPTEYKAVNTRSKSKGSYQFHWLSDKKVKKYSETKNMYFATRDGVSITEIYKLPTEKLLSKIEEKSTGGKSISGHVSFSLNQLKTMGAEQIK